MVQSAGFASIDSTNSANCLQLAVFVQASNAKQEILTILVHNIGARSLQNEHYRISDMGVPTNIKTLLFSRAVELAEIESKESWYPEAPMKTIFAFANGDCGVGDPEN